ncbi:MAG: hypothetical protein ACO3EK_02210 [Alphaproteobacteria bacterium]
MSRFSGGQPSGPVLASALAAMSQFTSASIHRVDPGSRPDIAERNPQGRSGRGPGVVDFGAILDRMAPRPPEAAEAPDRIDEPASVGRAAPDRETRRARENLSPARNERQHPQPEARAPRHEDKDASGATTAPVDDTRDVEDAATRDAPGVDTDSAAQGQGGNEGTNGAKDMEAPATEVTELPAGTATATGPEASGGSRDEALEQPGFTLEPAGNPEHVAAATGIGNDPVAASLLALGLPAQPVQAAPAASILPVATLPAAGTAEAAPLASPSATPAAMAAAVPAAPIANGQAVGGAGDPAFGTMLQAQAAAAPPREVQAAPQQARFPEAAQPAPATEIAPAARPAMTAAPVLVQAQALAAPALAAPTLAVQAMDAGSGTAATTTPPSPAATAPAISTPQAQVAVATQAVAAASGQGAMLAETQATSIDPAQEFAIEIEAPRAEATPHAQPSGLAQAATRPQQGAPAPVAAQLVAQGQAVDAAAQPQATAPAGQAATALAKADADAPALAVAEAPASAARKDTTEGALAAPPAPPRAVDACRRTRRSRRSPSPSRRRRRTASSASQSSSSRPSSAAST